MYHTFNQSFDNTVFTATIMALIYVHLKICMENLLLLLLCPLIARLSTEMDALVSFHFFVVMFASASIQAFISTLFAIVFIVVGLSIIHFGFSSPIVAFHLLTSAYPVILCHSKSFTSFSRSCCWLLSHFVVQSSASYSFHSASRHLHRPLTHSLQLVIAKVDFLLSKSPTEQT